jgi:protein phosphatase
MRHGDHMHHMRVSGASVRGGRPTNQDSFYAADPLIVVADGVGGAPAGEVASRLAVDAFVSAGLDIDPAEAARQANAAVRARAAADPDTRGMATTLEAAVLRHGQVIGVHVGDSVTFVEGHRITRPHNLAAELVAGGHLTPEEAAKHPNRAALVRAVGLDDDVAPETWSRPAVIGERYLLCSDGLTDALGDSLIGLLSDLRAQDPTTCTSTLIRLATEAGAHDNVTVITADIM